MPWQFYYEWKGGFFCLSFFMSMSLPIDSKRKVYLLTAPDQPLTELGWVLFPLL
ncbi:hypothetical protein KIS4809_3033 [Bacillus sp. ZZV12-4809]|nr:hypothetical protein KIS4809_3033 [Bacillus sp. ZZV12-4809]